MVDEGIAQELEAVRQRAGGELRPEDVVSFAADPTTALHARFEWDDTKASHLYRLTQARSIIRKVVVTLSDPPSNAAVIVRRYHSLSPERPLTGYRDVGEVRNREAFRVQLALDALRDAANRLRNAGLSELDEAVVYLEGLMAELRRRAA